MPIVLSRMISVFFYSSIILLTCVKWVKTLKWQQHLEETWEMTVEPHWDKEALNPLQCAQPSPAPGHSSPTAESVGTVSLMDTVLYSVALWMTPLRGVHVGLPHLSLSPNMWFSRQSCTGCPSETLCPSSASVRFGRWKQWLSPFPTTSWQVRSPRELRLLLAVNGEPCCNWAPQAEVDYNFSFLNVSWTLMRNYSLT